MRFIRTALCLTVACAALGVQPALANKENADRCMRVAAGGRDASIVKGLKIFGHKFNCHSSIEVKETYFDDNHRDPRRKREGEWEFTWRLSHALRFRKDDQVDYRITIKKLRRLSRRATDSEFECITSVSRRIKRGGFAEITGAVGRLIGKDDWERQWRNAAKDFDDRKNSWQDVGELLAGRLAQLRQNSVGCNYKTPAHEQKSYSATHNPAGTGSTRSSDSKAEPLAATSRSSRSSRTARVIDRRSPTSRAGAFNAGTATNASNRARARRTGSTSTRSIRARPPAPGFTMTGTVWAFDRAQPALASHSRTSSGRKSRASGKPLTLAFQGAGLLQVRLSCGASSGTWQMTQGSRSNVGTLDLAITRSNRSTCRDLALDRKLIADLKSAERYRIDTQGKRLSLRTKNGINYTLTRVTGVIR